MYDIKCKECGNDEFNFRSGEYAVDYYHMQCTECYFVYSIEGEKREFLRTKHQDYLNRKALLTRTFD